MEEERITIYGKNAEDQEKRAFDVIIKDGQACFETKDRYGNKVWTTAREALEACRKLRRRATA